jgi:glyoxylase-like metal-dependent hydrolase (beta-lactamase superfamily II)
MDRSLQQVAPGIFRLKIPLPFESLGWVNSYLVQSEGRNMLVDTGWNTDEAFDALTGQLSTLGVDLKDLHTILFTHVHPDHYGLAGRLAEFTAAELVMHEMERVVVHARYVDFEGLLDEMDQWLRVNGVPDHDRPDLSHASMAMLGMVAVALPTHPVRGGEHLPVGAFNFEIVWTPGHAPGHICLFDRESGLFFSGDHVLPGISPNISLHIQALGNPLADYEDSLKALEALPVRLVLPGHGEPFQDLSGRAREILAHHQQRNQHILDALQDGPRTAYEVAQRIPWNTKGVPWDELTHWVRRSAVTETLAHLEALRAEGRVGKTIEGDHFWYALP